MGVTPLGSFTNKRQSALGVSAIFRLLFPSNSLCSKKTARFRMGVDILDKAILVPT